MADSAKFRSKLVTINQKVATYEKSLQQMREQPVPSPIKQFYQVAIDKCQTALRKAVDLQDSMAGVPGFFEQVKSLYLERLASNIDDWNEDHEFIFEFTDELEVKYEEFSAYKERIQFRNLVQANYTGKR